MKSTFFYLCFFLPHPTSHGQSSTDPWDSVTHQFPWHEAPLSMQAPLLCVSHQKNYLCYAKLSQLRSQVIPFKFALQSNRVGFFLKYFRQCFYQNGSFFCLISVCSWPWPVLGARTAAVGSNGLNMSTVKDSSLIALVWGLFYAWNVALSQRDHNPPSFPRSEHQAVSLYKKGA